ncbi:LacI family transcriptional regulator [Sporosarcina sp. P21c]|uniref:LacI family DNA-binding transcriptional regulator n=1 Tax=unclassified Sporosarcina TaxID=2647733 RepID=UPI000C171DB3|nr:MULTISPECIES: substrate-binding domain-containing protein [unclassified Sporosarcina]PIC67831.1 LacI family transcriptional regulator [Sporosarcina sp. P16a]PIC83824.1 LacI family transcriptional regulator [Sporosarcina sp. P1]PIC90690.1 LacI family transcriptional regulator [Sporosarcina sp. P21c]PIC93455.1 LacI family transcriptional regulator [Sporosarcina sp. P25]
MKVTMADVAKKAGVSKSTVSQFINERYEFMAEKTKVKIQQSIEELGYIPNNMARSLKRKESNTIGIIVANILHTFSTEVIRAIEDVCEEKGVHVFVCNADDNPQKERSYIDMLRAKQVDGLIIFPTVGNEDLYADLRKNNFPIVFVDRRTENSYYPTIMLDNHKASEMAIDQFIEVGKNKIAIVSTSIERKVIPRIERIEGYQLKMKACSLPVEDSWLVATERENIMDALQVLWDKEEKPNAFYAINDLALMELMKFIKINNLLIPQDVAVIGLDDSPFLEVFTPAITVIKQPTFQMGMEAAQLLLKIIHDKEIPDDLEVQRYMPHLLKRESV